MKSCKETNAYTVYAEPVRTASLVEDRTPLSHQRERLVATACTAAFFACLTIIFAKPLFSSESWMIFVQDDLLYYLKVAQSLANGHGSTFNGLVETNGYQPLWLLVLVLLSYVTQSTRLILGFLAITNLAAAGATFFLSRKLLASSGVRPLLVFSLSAWVTLYSVTLFFYGMEVTLTVPLLLGVICLLRNLHWLEQGALHTFALGVLLSAMVLSRIDTLILGGLLLAGIIATTSLRRLMRPTLVAGAALGLLPIPAYFFMNHHFFNTWLPISGMAKELKADHLPSIEPWRVFFHPLAGGFALALLAGLFVWAILRRVLMPMDRVLFPAVILFPFLYYFILSCVSDWTLWGWYMYPIRTALCVSLLLFCLWPRSAQWLQLPLVTGLLLLTVLGALTRLRWTRQQTDIQAASVEIAQFAAAHPGIYAMGDRAGRVAYLIANPVVQTEGLMMDKSYLELIKAQQPLREVLARYHVRYYIATAYEPYTGCFEAIEPAKAGPASAHMKAEFCEQPLKRFEHDGIQTLLYDLEPGRDGK